jgi:hypothetical protein
MRSQKPGVVHRHLHLQHHHHTGRVLHHRHTSYRGLAVVLVLSAAFIVGLNVLSRATADSIYVTARNPAPIPATPAEITSPSDGTVIHTANLTVSGTCPVIVPRVIIAIVDNGTEVGSMACDTNNEFSVPVTLNYGDHTLLARSYTITDDTGPDSISVHVSYPLPPPPPIASSPNTTGTPQRTNAPSSQTPSEESGVSPLSITSAKPFIVYGPSKDALWIGHISGGKPPYTLTIDWGDGRNETHIVANSVEQYLRHHYRVVQSYDVSFTISDAAGQHLQWHIAAVSPYSAPVAPLLSTGDGSWYWHQWIGIYGAYLLLLAVFGYIWARSRPYQYAKVPVHIRKASVSRKHRRV